MARPSQKRGISGQANAQSQPFRMNGFPPDWQARKYHVNALPHRPSSGSKSMVGIMGGVLAQNLGLGKMYGDYERIIADAQERVTSEILRIDDDGQREAAE